MKRQVATAVVVLAMTACTPGGVDPAQAPSAPSTRPSAGGSTCDLQRLQTKHAVAASAPLSNKRTVPDRRGSAQVFSYAMDETGDILQEIGRSDDAKTLRPGELSIYDPSTGSSQTIRRRDERRDGTQTVFAALDKTYAAWVEESGTALTSAQWSMYVTSRRTGKTALVARARPVDATGSTPTVPGYTIPQLNDGWVYWAEARPDPRPGRAPVVSIYGKRLESPQPVRLVVKNAVMPVATGDWLYYTAFESGRPGGPGYAIHRKSLGTGATTIVHQEPEEGPAFLTAHQDVVAWSLGNRVVAFRGTKQIANISGRSGELLIWLSSGRDFVGFSDNSDGPGSNYLLDLRKGCLYNLGNAQGLSEVKLAGRFVMWSMRSTGQGQAHSAWRQATLP